VNDNISDELGTGSNDDQEPVAMGFLNPDDIEERVAAFRAALLRLDGDPAEAARIDMLIAGASAMFGDDLSPFEDPQEAKPVLDDARQGGTSITINGSHAQPRIAVDYAGHDGPDCGFSLVINGDHAEPRIQVGADQPGQEDDPLNEELEELRQDVAALRAQAEERPGKKLSAVHGSGPAFLAFLAGVAAAVAVHSTLIAQVCAITVLALALVLLLVAVSAAIFSGRDARRAAAFSVLRLLLNRVPPPEDPPLAGRSGRHLALSGREGRGVDR